MQTKKSCAVADQKSPPATQKQDIQFKTRESCIAADRKDPLSSLKQEFSLPEKIIYLDGNSLGAQPKEAAIRSAQVLQCEWGHGLIRSWNTAGWFDLPQRLGDKLARLVGAEENELVITDTISINVFKAMTAAVRLQQADHPERRVIVSERENFPTDLYMVQGMIELLQQGYILRLVDEELPLAMALAEDG